MAGTQIRALWKMTLVETKLFLREPMAAFFTLVFPMMMLFLFGSIYGNEPDDLFGGHGTVDISVPAYMAMIIGTVGLLFVAINMAAYREKGILRRYKTTPLRPITILLDTVLVNFMMTFLGTGLLIIAAILAYDLKFDGHALPFLLAFILASLSFFSLGFVIASLAPTTRVAQVSGMVLFYPMLFLSGASIPLQIMPESIQRTADFLPLSYVVRLLQGIWFGESLGTHLHDILILTGVLILGATVSALTFRWE
jgi:ABC-2 type transport system permease protein